MVDVKKDSSFHADLAAAQKLLSTAHPVSDVWKTPLYPLRHAYNKPFFLSLRHDRRYNLQPSDPIRRLPEHHSAPPVLLSTSTNARTADVLLSGPDAGLTFSDLALPTPILQSLHSQKITKPSPVQLRALPAARLGADVIVQAKSGTGKTLVFGIVAAEVAASSSVSQGPGALLVAPTRELAAQIARVTQSLCDRFAASPRVALAIGGCPEREDVARIAQAPPGVVVATPGRALALVEKGCLRMEALKLLVLDEADRLLDGSVGDTVPRICEMLPMRKQTLAFSATYPTKLQKLLCKVMRNPTHIQVQTEQDSSKSGKQNQMDILNRINASEDPNQRAVLLGVQQRKMEVEKRQGADQTTMTAKTTGLLFLLQHIPFSFCIVFTNKKKISKAVVHKLHKEGFGSAHMNADIRQADRIATMKSVADGSIQVLVTTDLLARGVDIDVCDLVVHLDIPNDCATYLHRVGRAGRFGKLGLSVVIYLRAEEAAEVHGIEKAVGFRMTDMQVQPPKPVGDDNALTSKDVSSSKRKRVNCADDEMSPDERNHHDIAKVAEADDSLRKIIKSTLGDVSDGRRKTIDVEHQPVGTKNHKKYVATPDAVEQTKSAKVPDSNVDVREDINEVAVIEINNQQGETGTEDFPPIQNVEENIWDTKGAKELENDNDGWNAYASRAYSEGYREGYEQAYRMASQLQARLGHCT